MELSRQAALRGKLKAVLGPNLLRLLVGQAEVDERLGLVSVLGAIGNSTRVHDGLVRVLGAHEGLLDAVVAEDVGAVDKTGHAVARRDVGGSGTDLVIGMEGAALYASSPNALEVLLGEALAKTWANRYNKNTDIVL